MQQIGKWIVRISSANPRKNPVGFCISFFGIGYLLFLTAPNVLFAESQSFGAVTVYAHTPLAGIEPEMRETEMALARSPINEPALQQRIYLTRSTNEFAWYAPRTRQALRATYSLFGTTFLSAADPAANTIQSSGDAFNVRPLSAGIAHERMHLMLAHHFGMVQTAFSPAWKQEGYCDYISGGHSIGTDANGLSLLSQDGREIPALAYFRDYIRVKYLLKRKHLTVDQLFAQSFDLGKLDREALAAFTA